MPQGIKAKAATIPILKIADAANDKIIGSRHLDLPVSGFIFEAYLNGLWQEQWQDLLQELFRDL